MYRLKLGSLLLLLAGSALADDGLHMNMIDPLGVIRDVYYVNQNGYPVVEGDIILRSKASSTRASIIPAIGGTRWPDGKIPFVLADDLPEATSRALNQAIALWREKTGVEFVPIDREYADYVYIQPAEGTTCSSEVGRKGGRQVINLAPRCNVMNIAHELGHTIGLWHEQSRQDRDQYVQIVWENIQADHASNFNQHLNDGEDHGAYNFDSLMHYSAYAFSKNGEKTIVPLQSNVSIGQRDHLSEGDIAAVREVVGTLRPHCQ